MTMMMMMMMTMMMMADDDNGDDDDEYEDVQKAHRFESASYSPEPPPPRRSCFDSRMCACTWAFPRPP
eukprot:5430037-Karenia_brevis.AAC.1